MKRLRDIFQTRYDAIIAGAAAFVFAQTIAGHGIPALRQDWQWPYSPEQMHSFLVDAWSGWNPSGMGAPAPYPSSYLLAIPTWMSFWVFGSAITLWLFLIATAAIVFVAARRLALALGANTTTAFAVAFFALFNPWVYAKVVAGHVVMVLAYGATFGLLRELAREPARFSRLALWLTLAFGQLQFFMLAMVAVAIFAVKRKAPRLALVYGVLIALPSIAGIVANYFTLRQIPYTLAWQIGQSVAPGKALILAGYFTMYSEAIRAIAYPAMYVFVALAVLGAVSAFRSKAALVIAATTAFFLIAVTGVRGPIALLYQFVVLHVPGSGVFRELYDLLGYVAIGYALLAAIACRRFPILRYAAMPAALALCVAWIVQPPLQFFVSRDAIPSLDVRADENSRFALFPPFQPLSYNGRGSGVDPDAFRRPGNVTPLNSYVRLFPADVALMRYAQSGDTSLLSALSVSLIAQRPALRSDVSSLSHQLAANAAISGPKQLQTVRIPYMPELTLGALPLIGSLDNNIGAGNMFFGDATEMPNFTPIAVSNQYVDMDEGWVDARLAYVSFPSIAQGLGGAATRSRTARLAVAGGRDALVYVSGSLLSDATALVRSTHGYAWIHLPDSVHTVQCQGFCVVVGESRLVRRFALNPPQRPHEPLTLNYAGPWLVTTSVPSGDAALLRYNVAYDRAWIAWAGAGLLRHVRIDTAVNGWLLPARARSERIVIVEYVAALQTLLEVLGSLAACAVLAMYLAEKIRQWGKSGSRLRAAPVAVKR